jgi:hypothetical protein
MFSRIKETPITISIAILAMLAFLIPSSVIGLELDTTTNLLMQVPQILGCHLLHWSFEHLSWDLFMFVLVGLICERRGKLAFASVLLMSAIAIPIFVDTWVPTVHCYRGLSGIDTALFGYAALLLIAESAREGNWPSVWMYGFLYAGMLGKIGYELLVGGTIFVSSESFSPVPIAHIVGAVIGSLVAGVKIIGPHIGNVIPTLVATMDQLIQQAHRPHHNWETTGNSPEGKPEPGDGKYRF